MVCSIAVYATHAASMAALGHEVIGVDVDPLKVSKLSSGRTPFFEPGLDDLLQENLNAGRLTFTCSYEEAAESADVHLIAVATSQKRGELGADLTYVDSAITTLVPLIRKPTVICGKSTVPVGTAARLSRMVENLSRVGTVLKWPGTPIFHEKALRFKTRSVRTELS